MLCVEGLDVFYGDVQILREVSFRVREGEIVTLVGSNAAGKTTCLNTISGLLRPRGGSVAFGTMRLDRLPPEDIVASGVVQVPEGRRLFPLMTVEENLLIGSYTQAARPASRSTLEKVFSTFPVLRERRSQTALSLSGGEQQMCAIARALMAQPKLLMLDEPSLGLAPIYVRKMFEVVQQIRSSSTTILLVEQNVRQSLRIADRAYVLENGRIAIEGTGMDLLADPNLKKAYLGL